MKIEVRPYRYTEEPVGVYKGSKRVRSWGVWFLNMRREEMLICTLPYKKGATCLKELLEKILADLLHQGKYGVDIEEEVRELLTKYQ